MGSGKEARQRFLAKGDRRLQDAEAQESNLILNLLSPERLHSVQVPFHRPSLTNAEIVEVIKCLKSGWLTTGPKVRQFENEFAAFVAQQHAVALNSCTAALHLALEAIGLQSGDVAVVPTMTFAATAEVVRYFNATPLLVDCREPDFNLDVADAERRIELALANGARVVAILPVHYGGQIGDVAGVQSLARRFQLKVIEDAAHCCPAYYGVHGNTGGQDHGVRDHRLLTTDHTPQTTDHGPWTIEGEGGREAEGRGRQGKAEALKTERLKGSTLNSQLSTLNFAANGWQPVGASADITCFSFYANKCITTGEGGMACTQNDDCAERMRIMSLHGISKDAWKRFTAEGSWYYEIVAPGFKYNLTDIAAAIGIHQLRRADELHRKRTRWAGLYSELLAGVEEVILPTQQPDRIHSWHLYVIRLTLDQLRINRAEVIDALKQAGVTTSVHWMPLHMHPYYREKYGYKPEDFPMAARLYPEIITLPLYPDMTEAEVTYVCDSLTRILRGNLGSKTGRRLTMGPPTTRPLTTDY
jgi:dTDP-4-amino-4,6-dideoxygalactose transaminase